MERKKDEICRTNDVRDCWRRAGGGFSEDELMIEERFVGSMVALEHEHPAPLAKRLLLLPPKKKEVASGVSESRSSRRDVGVER